MTTTETAQFLGVNGSRVRQLIAEGQLRAEKAGRDWLIHRRDVEALRKTRQELPATKRRGRPPNRPGS